MNVPLILLLIFHLVPSTLTMQHINLLNLLIRHDFPQFYQCLKLAQESDAIELRRRIDQSESVFNKATVYLRRDEMMSTFCQQCLRQKLPEAQCDIRLCHLRTGHFDRSKAECACQKRWSTSPDCSVPDCGRHGVPDPEKPENCVCDNDWSGAFCDQILCYNGGSPDHTGTLCHGCRWPAGGPNCDQQYLWEALKESGFIIVLLALPSTICSVCAVVYCVKRNREAKQRRKSYVSEYSRRGTTDVMDHMMA